MKIFFLGVIIIGALIAIDHFDLLQTRDSYPPAVNRIILAIKNADFGTSKESKVEKVSQSDSSEVFEKRLYRWKNDEGVWEISDEPPRNTVYEVFTLGGDSISTSETETAVTAPDDNAAPSQAELKREAQCRYAVEEIENYKNKMRFGGPSEAMSHWQRNLDYYRRIAMASCGSFEAAD